MRNRQHLLCPSAACRPGAKIIGAVTLHGIVVMSDTPREIDESFVAIAGQGRSPTRRFRFADRCCTKACRHWDSGICRVAESAVSRITLNGSEIVRDCAIRDACRWYSQEAEEACRVCPFVITDRSSNCDQQLSGTSYPDG